MGMGGGHGSYMNSILKSRLKLFRGLRMLAEVLRGVHLLMNSALKIRMLAEEYMYTCI